MKCNNSAEKAAGKSIGAGKAYGNVWVVPAVGVRRSARRSDSGRSLSVFMPLTVAEAVLPARS